MCSMFLGSWFCVEIVPQIFWRKIILIWYVVSMNTSENILSVQFEASFKSKISSICTNSENMQEIDQNVPQFYDFWKCSSGSRILRSQFFPGLEHLNTLIASKAIRQGVSPVFLYFVGRAECVRCPWLLAQTKVATIFDIFPHVGVGVVLTLLPFTPEGIVVGF